MRSFLAIFAILVATTLPARAQTSPPHCFNGERSFGITGTLIKMPFSKTGFVPASEFTPINLSLGGAENWNFLWTSDCTVPWLTLSVGGEAGVGQAPLQNIASFNLTAFAFVGVYGGYLRVGVGCDFLNLAPGSIFGLLTGSVIPQNCALYAGTGVQLAQTAQGITIAPISSTTTGIPPAERPPGWRDETAPAALPLTPLPVGYVSAQLRQP